MIQTPAITVPVVHAIVARVLSADLLFCPRSASVLNNPTKAEPLACRPGAFSGTPGITMRQSQTGRPSPMAQTRPKSAKKASPTRGPKPTYGDNFSENKAYRVGGGFVSKPPPPKDNPTPKKVSELEAQKLKEKQGADLQKVDAHGMPVKRMNERQWEKVVTRLYGTPGGEDDPINRRKEKQESNAKKMHPEEIERSVDRLYHPDPHKEQWILDQRGMLFAITLFCCRHIDPIVFPLLTHTTRLPGQRRPL